MPGRHIIYAVVFTDCRGWPFGIYLPEVFQFFTISLGGMVIDVIAFFFFVKVMGPQFEIPPVVWVKFSVIFAGIAAAFWNFLGYKHYVFKK